MWQSGRLSDEQSFQNNEDGWQALSDYLSITKNIPTYLVADLIEENFQRDTLPHVVGKARKSLIERRLSQLYHDTSFRHASYQGREKTGRRNDIILFSALTNAPLIKPWINIILKQKTPIAALYSAALLCSLLFNKLRLGNEPTLLITHQSNGLRQSFFQGGYFRFSRLILLPSQEPEAIAKVTLHEIEKTRVFLGNSRLLQRGEPLQIVTLANPDTLQKLQDLIAQTKAAGSEPAELKAVTHRFIHHDEASRLLGLKQLSENTTFDSLFLLMLAARPPASHYKTQEKNYAYTLWQSRIILYALSVATMAGCLLWSSANMIEAFYTGSQLKQLKQITLKNQQLSQNIADSMPKTAVDPHDMKTVVELHNLIIHNLSTPTLLFNIISEALAPLKQLRLNELNWEINDKTDSEEPQAIDQDQTSTTLSATKIGLPAKPGEVVVLKGEVVPFNNNYRAAIESINQFAKELTKNKHIKVNIIQLPLDIRSSVPLTGTAGDADERQTAPFELRIMWKT